MKSKPRPMKKYLPRRRRSSKTIQRKQLHDLLQLLDMDLSSYLILKAEGTPKQADQARAKFRTDLRKQGHLMKEISKDLAEGFPEAVAGYLSSLLAIASLREEIASNLFATHKQKSTSLLSLIGNID